MENAVINAADLELLKKLGIKLPTKRTSLEQKIAAERQPKTTNLTPYSGKVTRFCACCGKTTETFVDYVKREGCDGYAMRTVISPSNQIMRFHVYTVLSCVHCNTENIKTASTEELIAMIQRLRDKVVAVQQAQKLTAADK